MRLEESSSLLKDNIHRQEESSRQQEERNSELNGRNRQLEEELRLVRSREQGFER
jgi:hypothetical protein